MAPALTRYTPADSSCGKPPAEPATIFAASRSLAGSGARQRSEEHTSELQSQSNLVCRLLLEKKTVHTNGDMGLVPFITVIVPGPPNRWVVPPTSVLPLRWAARVLKVRALLPHPCALPELVAS